MSLRRTRAVRQHLQENPRTEPLGHGVETRGDCLDLASADRGRLCAISTEDGLLEIRAVDGTVVRPEPDRVYDLIPAVDKPARVAKRLEKCLEALGQVRTSPSKLLEDGPDVHPADLLEACTQVGIVGSQDQDGGEPRLDLPGGHHEEADGLCDRRVTLGFDGHSGSVCGPQLLSNDQTFSIATPSQTGEPVGVSGARPVPETGLVASAEPVRIPGFAQTRFGLGDFAAVKPRAVRRRDYRARPISTEQPDDLDRLYEQRAAARLTKRSVTTYRWLRKDMLACASAVAGRRIGLLELFADRDLLGRVLVSDRLAVGRACSKSTIAHRRTAIRSVASVLRPELQAALGCDPHEVIREALRSVAERRGGGYRITGGASRTKGGPAPSAGELRAIIAAMGQAEGWFGLRDCAYVMLLASTASRVNALRTLDGADCHGLPGDRVRVLLHQKNGRARHEVELDQESREALRIYVFAYNEAMRSAGRSDRVVLGEPGPIWRTERGRQLPDKALRAALRQACRSAGTPDYTPHAFRRAWATAASEVLPRWEGALGGGWRGTERFDASYVTPSRAAVWRKVAAVGVEDRSPPESGRARREPATSL